MPRIDTFREHPIPPVVISPPPVEQDPVALQLAREIERRSLDTAKAALDRAYRTVGGGCSIGVCGKPTGEFGKIANGVYQQTFEWGQIHIRTDGANPAGEVNLQVLVADVSLAAVKCLGTDDPEEDETYVVMGVVSAADGFGVATDIARAWRSPIQEKTRKHDTILANTPIPGFDHFVVGANGLRVRIVIMDHESGSPDDVRADIQSWIDTAGRDSKKAADDWAQSGGPALADIPSEVLTKLEKFLVGTLADALADDKIGEKTFTLSPQWLADLANGGHDASRVDMRNEVAAPIFVNYPRTEDDPFSGAWLFTNGSATYKAYLNVSAHWERRTL